MREGFTLRLRTSHCHVHSGRMQYCLAKIASCADCLSHIFCSQGYMESGVFCLAYVLCDILGKTDAQPLKNEICLIFKTVLKSCRLILRKRRIAHLNSFVSTFKNFWHTPFNLFILSRIHFSIFLNLNSRTSEICQWSNVITLFLRNKMIKYFKYINIQLWIPMPSGWNTF